MLLWFVILYIAAFAIAMGPIPWILCSEIFPAKLRGRAMSISTFAIWTANYLVIQSFPYLNESTRPLARLSGSTPAARPPPFSSCSA